MSNHHRDYSRLCRLIHDSLSSYADDSMLRSSLTKEIERSLLIHLSQVYTKIKQWTQGLKYDPKSDSDSVNEVVQKPLTNAEGLVLSCSHSNHHHCLPEIICHLMAVLILENPYVQHLTGNILVAISEFVVVSESGWDEFIHSMCFCLKLATDNSLLPYSESMTTESKDSEYDFSVPVMLFKCKLKSANLSTAAVIIGVTRNVLKLLKQDFGDQNLKVYRDSICRVISGIMPDVLNKVCTTRRGESVKGSSRDVLTCLESAKSKSMNIFQANLLQLFCSLVDNNDLMESGAGSADNQIIISTIINLIPELLAWCLGEAESSDNIQILHYFKHKMLMLLIRLSSQIHLDCSVLSLWLNLIHIYFQNLLSEPIISMEAEHYDSLEGSPFRLRALDGKREIVSPTHLQRLAVFLFLRCSFSLINTNENISEECTCSHPKSGLAISLNTDSESCRTSRGLLELQRWLKGHLPTDIFDDGDMYSKRCVSFAICFLQLYMHEDDILFEMLLQLFCMPVYPDQCIASLVAENNTFALVSDIFNPIHMYHFFLSEVHYDHQVLLDYLISKDLGASSAEYLLRSLRIICDSWNLFVEFPGTWKALSNSEQKRRKVTADGFDLKCVSSTTSVLYDGTPSSAKLNCRTGCAYTSIHGIIKRLSFEDAKDCLFSLQTSIESLSQKDLFPYNPRVLLRRLARFQELCQTL